MQSVCAQARVGHGDLPRDPLVQAMVLAQLAPGEPVPLDADDCARLGGSDRRQLVTSLVVKLAQAAASNTPT